MDRDDSGPYEEGTNPVEPGETREPLPLESDPRFPSGPWTGFFLQRILHQDVKGWMDLDLEFCMGKMRGTGRDRVGLFTIAGNYHIDDGRCHFRKQYLGQHRVEYTGYNEGKGIWGTWSIALQPGHELRGGFHIWPLAMGDPTQRRLAVELDIPETERSESPAPEPALC